MDCNWTVRGSLDSFSSPFEITTPGTAVVDVAPQVCQRLSGVEVAVARVLQRSRLNNKDDSLRLPLRYQLIAAASARFVRAFSSSSPSQKVLPCGCRSSRYSRPDRPMFHSDHPKTCPSPGLERSLLDRSLWPRPCRRFRHRRTKLPASHQASLQCACLKQGFRVPALALPHAGSTRREWPCHQDHS